MLLVVAIAGYGAFIWNRRKKIRVVFTVGPNTKLMSPAIVQITTEQQVPLSVAFYTATGNPAPVVGTPTWSIDDTSVVDIVVASDGLSALIVSKAVGTCLVTVEANAGSKVISGTINITVVAAEAEVVEITPGAVEPKPVIITVSVTIQPDGSALIEGQGAPNKTYRILAADAVTGPYTEIGSATADATGAFSFVDTDAPAHPTRFYRAVWP